jgi:outer membrane protein assembly factor BamE
MSPIKLYPVEPGPRRLHQNLPQREESTPPSGAQAGARRSRRTAASAALLSAVLITAGCGSVTGYLPHFLEPYRPDIQQGNVITSDMVDQLRPGMTRDQVRFMLGTPLLTDAFHPERWDYLYYLNPRVGAPQRRNLVVYFKDNRLDHFTSDPMPPESMADNLILGQKPYARSSTPPKAPALQAAPPESDSPKEPASRPAAPGSDSPPASQAPQGSDSPPAPQAASPVSEK